MAEKVFGLTEEQFNAMEPVELQEYLKSTITQEDIDKMPDDQVEALVGLVEEKHPKPVIEEQHPDLGFGLRAKIKNFGIDTPQTIAAIRKERPDLIVTTDDDNRILLKKRGEEAFRVIDPDTGFFSSPAEFGKDIVDVAYDVPTSIAQDIAAGAAGLFSLPVPFVGGMPAAMATSAAAGAGIEGARQSIGKALGLGDAYDSGQIGTATVLGGIMPGVLGTGAKITGPVAKDVLNKKAAQVLMKKYGANVSEDAVSALADKYAQSQRGLFGRALHNTYKYGPARGEAMSGVPQETIAYARDNLDKLDKYSVMPYTDKYNYMKDSIEAADEAIRKELSSSGKELRSVINKNTNTTLDAGIGSNEGIEAALRQGIADLKRSERAKTPAAKKAIKQLENTYKNFFEEQKTTTKKVFGGDKYVPSKEFYTEPTLLESGGESVKLYMPETRDIYGRLIEGSKEITETLPYLKEGEIIGPQKIGDFVPQYNFEKTKGFAPMSSEMTLPQAWRMQKRLENSSKLFQKPDLFTSNADKLSGQDSKETALFLADAASALKSKILGSLDDADRKAYEAANKRYSMSKDLQESAAMAFGERPERKMQLLSNPANRDLMEIIKNVDKTYGTNLEDTARLVKADIELGEPSWNPKSGQGTTGTLRGGVGAAVGGALASEAAAKMALNPSGHGLLKALGYIGGSRVKSPAAVKNYIRVGRASRKLNEALNEPSVGYGEFNAPLFPMPFKSAWMGMGPEFDESRP